MEPYEVDEHVAALSASGMTLYAYAKQKGVSRRTLAEGIKEHRPDVYPVLVGKGGEGQGAAEGRKLEASAKGRLERRGYYVVKSYASKSPIDMLAVGKDKPSLMVQAKRSGSIGSAEWNALYAAAEAHGCWPVLVRRPEGETKGALWYKLTRPREFREPQKGLLESFDPADPYALALAVV